MLEANERCLRFSVLEEYIFAINENQYILLQNQNESKILFEPSVYRPAVAAVMAFILPSDTEKISNCLSPFL